MQWLTASLVFYIIIHGSFRYKKVPGTHRCVCQKFLPVRVCGYITWLSELENLTLLTVHTHETVTSLTPRGTLTEIHLLCITRWQKSFFLRLLLLSVTSNRSFPPPRGCQSSSGESDVTVPLLVTELTIDLRHHKHDCRAGYLQPINLRLNQARLGTAGVNHREN